MDDFDRAAARELMDRDCAIEAARGHYASDWRTASAVECVGCAAAIPDGRRQAVPGVQLCVEFQTDAERAAHFYRKDK
jgi:phage/conjugal plasmid C-4 type zinc finger TraR family protein